MIGGAAVRGCTAGQTALCGTGGGCAVPHVGGGIEVGFFLDLFRLRNFGADVNVLVNCEARVGNAGTKRNKNTFTNKVQLQSSRCPGPFSCRCRAALCAPYSPIAAGLWSCPVGLRGPDGFSPAWCILWFCGLTYTCPPGFALATAVEAGGSNKERK